MVKLLLLFLVTLAAAAGRPDTMLQGVSPAPHLRRPQKLSHLHFYFHDILSGRNPTATTVAQAPSTKTSPTGFGMVNMMDDPLTVGPELNSTLVGRAQGFYAAASQEEVGLIVAMNLAFVEGKYNGSTIAVLGRNLVLSQVREMPIVGGSGVFRFAEGYVQARTHWYDVKSGDATVEYNVYVLHY